MPVMLANTTVDRRPWWEMESHEWSRWQFRRYARFQARLRRQGRSRELPSGELEYQQQSWDERGHEEWGETPGGSEEEGRSSEDSLDLRCATIMRDIRREHDSGSDKESPGTRRVFAEIKPARRIGPMGEERRRRIARGVRGLGFEGRGTVGMNITYHEGPIAVRMSRKCSRSRNTQFKSGVRLDPDVEAGRE